MIAVFTDPNDAEFVSWARKTANLAGLDDSAVRIVPLDRKGLAGREYLVTVREMDACIIDMDQGDLIGYASELGSLAEGLTYLAGGRRADRERVLTSYLDARVMLVTRGPLKENKIQHWFGEYYSITSLENGFTPSVTDGVAAWIAETLDSAAPRVFISYRANQRDFARKVAQSLKRRGASVWFDEFNLLPGDSIPDAVSRGLGWCTHLVLVVDDGFFDSRWTQAEVETILHRQLSKRAHVRWGPPATLPLIPLFLGDPASSSMPELLRRIRGIDCRELSFPKSMNRLWNAIATVKPR